MDKLSSYFKGVKPTRLTATEFMMKRWEKIKKQLRLHVSSFSTPHSKADIWKKNKKKNA